MRVFAARRDMCPSGVAVFIAKKRSAKSPSSRIPLAVQLQDNGRLLAANDFFLLFSPSVRTRTARHGSQ